MRAESKYGIYPTWSDMLALLGVFVAATVLCNMLGVLLVRTGSVSEGFSAFVCYGVQFAVTILYALWVRRHRTARGTKLLRFGVRRVDPAVVLWGLVMTIATSLVVEPLVNWMPEGMLELLNRQMGLGGWMMLTSIVLAPVLEEILFRGIVQDSLTEKLGPLRGILIGGLRFRNRAYHTAAGNQCLFRRNRARVHLLSFRIAGAGHSDPYDQQCHLVFFMGAERGADRVDPPDDR